MRIIGVLLASIFAVGCYATASPGYYGPGVAVTATTVGPDLVYAAPGVQVIAGYDGDPVFYSDGFYWRETGGVWYRSSYHTHGWASYRAPHSVYSIRNRHSYRNYRPAGYTPRRYDNRSTYRPDRRDTRTNRPDSRAYGNNRPAPRVDSRPAPVTQKRDNRPAPRDDKKKDRRR